MSFYRKSSRSKISISFFKAYEQKRHTWRHPVFFLISLFVSGKSFSHFIWQLMRMAGLEDTSTKRVEPQIFAFYSQRDQLIQARRRWKHNFRHARQTVSFQVFILPSRPAGSGNDLKLKMPAQRLWQLIEESKVANVYLLRKIFFLLANSMFVRKVLADV